MIQEGFSQSKADYSLFYKGSGEVYVALLVYVDDIVVNGGSIAEIDTIKKEILVKSLSLRT